MFYTIFWVILWLFNGGASLAIGTPQFWALVVALIVDIFWFGYWQRGWVRRPAP